MQCEQDSFCQFERESCLRTIEADILHESRVGGDVVVVCVAGHSAGGKSTVSEELAFFKPNYSVIHMDDYMAGEMLPFKAPPSPERPFLAGINPEVFDLNRLHDDLLRLIQGKTIDKPVFDRSTHKRASSSVTVPSNKVIILEGLYALTNGFVEHANFGVFVDSPLHDRLMRKIIRGLQKYEHKDINKVICSYLDMVEPNYKIYVEHLKANAKYLIQNTGMAKTEKVETSKVCPTSCEEGYKLIPKFGNGSVHPGENLTILKNGSTLTMVYTQNGVDILVEDISAQALVSLKKYYELTAFTKNG